MMSIEQVVDALHIEDLRNEVHPSFFDENEEYNMLIIRLPIIDEILEAKSLGFVYTSDTSYFYNKVEEGLEALENRFESPYKLIDKILNQLLKSFTHYQDSIADMGELLYANSTPSDFMTTWLKLKQDLSRIEHILLRTSSAMNEFIKYYENEEGFPMNNYVDLHEHSERIARSASLQLSKLDDLYSFHTIQTNEKMNKMIYILTIVSGVFLPLNLMVGFFGMNTSGLPFTAGINGSFNAVILMSLLFISTSITLVLWNRKVK